jgi:hypothetical protein
MHGNDERIGVEALRTGGEFMYRLFDRFRAADRSRRDLAVGRANNCKITAGQGRWPMPG